MKALDQQSVRLSAFSLAREMMKHNSDMKRIIDLAQCIEYYLVTGRCSSRLASEASETSKNHHPASTLVQRD